MTPAADPGLIGRATEHAVAVRLLDAAARGPAALVITGPAGIGKSTILRTLLADARGRGCTTLETRAVEAECQLALGGLADLLDPVADEVLDRLPPAQRHALEVALQRIPADGAAPPLALSMAALAAIRALAEHAPVIVAVDDLPWLDAASARVLEYLVRRLGDARVGFVPAVREERADARLPAAAEAFEGPVERLHVGPLDLNAIEVLVRRETGLSLRRPALAWLHGQSGGNPFLALEIARAIRRTGAQPGLEGLAPPAAAGELVRERLVALGATSRWSLAAVAALSLPSVETVEAAIPGSAEALEAARAAGVLEIAGGRARFTHPLLAAGAYGLLDPVERRELHARLGAAAPDPEQRARHLALSVEGASEEVASELERAAAAARLRGASDTAAQLALEAAHRTPDEEPDGACRRIVAAGEYLIEAGDPVSARAVLERHVATAAPGPGRADALRVLADARSSDDWEAKIRLLDEALDEAGTDRRLRARILEASAQARWHTLRDAAEQVALATAAVAEAEAQDDPAARVGAYQTAVFAHQGMGEGVAQDLLARAMALEPQVEHLRVFMWPSFCRALTDLASDRLERGIETLRRLEELALAKGDWDSPPLITNNLAWALLRTGDWPEARERALEAERGARVNGQAEALAFTLATRAWFEAATGGEAAALRATDEGLALAREIGARIVELDHRSVLGFLALTLGDARRAAEELEAATQPLLDAGYRDPADLDSVPDWAEALVAIDRAEEADRLLDGYEATARRLGRASAIAAALRVRGLVAASRGDEAAAERAFTEALAQHDRVPEPFARARTLLARGEALRRFRRRGAAREALAEAAAIFERLGARPWHERAAAELARTGHRETGASLSPTERQVAELVAAGRTNREVAEALFMSPHTVEAHLTRVYRSLGVRGRTELARALLAADGHGTDAGRPVPDEGQG